VSFLDSVVIPNGSTIGVLIILGELAVGAAFIAAAALWAFRWEGLGSRGRTAVLAATAAAALGGIFMNVNFHVANGSAHPWLIPGEGFDEGVDLDSLMPAIQLVFAVWPSASGQRCVRGWRNRRACFEKRGRETAARRRKSLRDAAWPRREPDRSRRRTTSVNLAEEARVRRV